MRRILTIPVLLGAVLLALLGASDIRRAEANGTTATTIPVVFVPGIGGTRLADINNVEYWTAAGYSGHDQLSLYPKPAHVTVYPTNAITEATFLGFHVPSEDWQTYGPLFDYLGTQGFVQYDTHQDAYYQTSAGCDLTQAANHPNLFVFAYDWRISNAENATLLQDYIACVRMFYPGTNVNLVAHSMGGLVARRYILDYPGAHHVNAYLSVSTPFLGSGKVVWVEETGQYVFFVWASTLFTVVGSFNGASELMNSQAWYDLGGVSPLIENGQDLNGDGKTNEKFTYAQLVQYMDTVKGQQGFLPGTTNQVFHSYSNGGNKQDDWRGDTTGVKYFHIAGSGTLPDTINQVVAASFLKCLEHFSSCDLSTWMYPQFSLGDQTVPLLSLTRQGASLNYNAPNATLYTCQAFGANSQNVDHTGLLSNPVVQQLLIGYLTQANGGSVVNPPPATECGNGGSVASRTTAAEGTYRLTLSGVKNIQVEDGTADPFVDGAARYDANADSTVLLLAAEKHYEVTFELTGAPLYVEWLHRKGKKIVGAMRIVDQPVQANAKGHFALDSGSISELEYDADHDGSFEASIPADVELQGKPARDLRPPKLEIEEIAQAGTHLISISETDRGTGTKVIAYSTDGKHFQVYEGPFTVPANVTKIYAFADDAAGNRSKLFLLTRK